ncbi:MAG: hypothetical protein ACYDHP_01490 [Ferrimicrobium sp.]
MGLLDKIKDQAATVTNTAKDAAQSAAQKGQDKFSEIQASRNADALLRELGLATYQRETGTLAPEQADETIARLTTALRDHESTNGPLKA